MSVVVLGGNDRMASRYKNICESYKCKAKVFTQMPADLAGKLGSPDLMVVFTDTCCHKMANCVKAHSAKTNIPIEHIHSASVSSLKSVLERYCR